MSARTSGRSPLVPRWFPAERRSEEIADGSFARGRSGAEKSFVIDFCAPFGCVMFASECVFFPLEMSIIDNSGVVDGDDDEDHRASNAIKSAAICASKASRAEAAVGRSKG